jgi:hypothetical protein
MPAGSSSDSGRTEQRLLGLLIAASVAVAVLHTALAIGSGGRFFLYRMGDLWAFLRLPSPTTGMTRAALAAWDGRWLEAFQWSPLGPVILATHGFAVVEVWVARVRTGIFRLRAAPAYALLGALACSWVVKALQGARWW